jgi:hypothetical protein
MEINLNPQVESLPQMSTGQIRRRAVPPAANDTQFNQSQALESRLNSEPDIRVDKVARATRLLSDGSYPPPVTIRKIATLLAANQTPPNSHTL